MVVVAGMDLNQTKGWFAYVLQTTNSADITNNFLAFGLRGGAASMLLLLLLLVSAFSALGIAMRANTLPSEQKLLWGLGCMLAVHTASWFGISYFDQITVFWFLQLAMVGTLYQHHRALCKVPVCDPRPAGLKLKQISHRSG